MGIFDDIKDTAEDAFGKGKDEVYGGVDDLKDKIEKEVFDRMEEKFRDVRGEIGKGIDEIKEDIERQVRHAIEELAALLSKEAIQKYVRSLEIFTVQAAGFKVSAGVVTISFSWDVTEERMQMLRNVREVGVQNKRGVIKIIEALGPEKIHVEIGVQADIGISLGAGGFFEIDLPTFLDKIDELL